MEHISDEQMMELFEEGGETMFDRLIRIERASGDYRRSILRSIDLVRDGEEHVGMVIDRLKRQSDYIAGQVKQTLETIFLDDAMFLDEKFDMSWNVITQDAGSRKITFGIALADLEEADEEELIESVESEIISLKDYRDFCKEIYFGFNGAQHERLELLYEQVQSEHMIGVISDLNVFCAELLSVQADEA